MRLEAITEPPGWIRIHGLERRSFGHQPAEIDRSSVLDHPKVVLGLV
jgi:hypothetical protein